MARWQPDSPQRLVIAALDLFAAKGYERTTVIEIAERAGVTKSTFFRHFADKREVLFGGDVVADPLVRGIAAAPAEATPLEAVAHAIEVVGAEAFTADRRALLARRHQVIATSAELREREALKVAGLTSIMAEALEQRGAPPLDAIVAANLGSLAMQLAYDEWTDAAADVAFVDLALSALDAVQASAATSTAKDRRTTSTRQESD